MKFRKIIFLFFLLFNLFVLVNKVEFNAAIDDKVEATGDYQFNVEVHDVPTIDDIREIIALEATDEYDGDLTNKIQVNDIKGYSEKVVQREIRERELGLYPLEFIVEDSSGNSSSFTLNVLVSDTVDPYVLDDSVLNYEAAVDDICLTDEEIIENIHAFDDHDGDNVIVTIKSGSVDELEEEINIEQFITVSIKDQSGNEFLQEIVIILKDYGDPFINAPNTMLTTSYYANANVNSLLDSLNIKVSDNFEDGLTYTIDKDNYTTNKNKVGKYIVTIKASDSSGNYSTKDITITVNDDIPPVFYIDVSKVYVKTDVKLTDYDFVSLLKSNGFIKQEKYEFYVIENTYSQSSDIEGEYVYACRVSYSEDDYNDYKFMVNVIPKEKIVLSTWQMFLNINKKIGQIVVDILKWPILKFKEMF